MPSYSTTMLPATQKWNLESDGPPSVTVVIVHWMNNADTAECLQSLAEVDYPCLSVILVNNGSPDFEESSARQAFPSVQIVTSDHNLGVAGGNNLGITKALEQGCDLICLLNPDTIVDPNLIRALLPAFNGTGVAIVGPIITYYDAPDTIWFAGGIYSQLVGSPRQPHMNRPLKSSFPTEPVDWLNSCALLVKREVFETVGPFWKICSCILTSLSFVCERARPTIAVCWWVNRWCVTRSLPVRASVERTILPQIRRIILAGILSICCAGTPQGYLQSPGYWGNLSLCFRSGRCAAFWQETRKCCPITWMECGMEYEE